MGNPAVEVEGFSSSLAVHFFLRESQIEKGYSIQLDSPKIFYGSDRKKEKMYPWFVYLHILGVFGFLIFHGVSISVAFALRREQNLERIRALIELSGHSIGFVYISIIILLLSGIVTGFMGRWWGQGWIWVSLGLLIGILVYMGFAGSGYYGQVRKAVGPPYMQG